MYLLLFVLSCEKMAYCCILMLKNLYTFPLSSYLADVFK